MDTEEKFKGSPLHNKESIIELMDKLNPEGMTNIVEYITEQVKLFSIPVVRKCCNAMCDDDAVGDSVYCEFHGSL